MGEWWSWAVMDMPHRMFNPGPYLPRERVDGWREPTRLIGEWQDEIYMKRLIFVSAFNFRSI